MKSPFRKLEDGWDAKIRLMEEPAQLQAEMVRLEEEYARLRTESLTQRFAFVPAHPTWYSYITANFLHGGWLHLIGNMWFLWLAGFVLEDNWGRWLYSAVYLVAGAAALQFHAWMNPLSTAPTLGASGAVAALMGAFLVRFPKMKIEMGWLWFSMIRFVRFYRFSAPAWALLPLWVIGEAFSGALFGTSSGTAHWAHVGGFVFGAVVSLGIKYSGLEKKLNAKVIEETEWTTDPELEQASTMLHSGKSDEALPILEGYIKKKPDSVDAWTLLREVYKRYRNDPAYLNACLTLCTLHIKAGEIELAEGSVGDFVKGGGKHLPAQVWLDYAAAYEDKGEHERAVHEYETLSKAYVTDRESVLAQLAAGKIYLQQLSRPKDALKFYQAAAVSRASHADLNAEIQAGLRDAGGAGMPLPTAAAPVQGFQRSTPAIKMTPSQPISMAVAASAQSAATETSEPEAEMVPAWASAGPEIIEIDAPAEPKRRIAISESSEPETLEMVPTWTLATPAPKPVAAAASPVGKPQVPPAAASKPVTVHTGKPHTWGHFDAPPVWGHGAKGDTIHKPEVVNGGAGSGSTSSK